MKEVRPEVGAVALTRMLRAHVVENRALMERIGKPKAMLRKQDGDTVPVWIEELAERLGLVLPPGVTAQQEKFGSSGLMLLLSYDGFDDSYGFAAAVISPMVDAEDSDWALVGGFYASESDGEQDEDEGKERALVMRALVNHFNDNVPAGAWLLLPHGIGLANVGVLPKEDWNDNQLHAAVESVNTAVAYGSFAFRRLMEDESDHPAYIRELENEQLNRSAGNLFTVEEMREALEAYRNSLPELLASVTELRHQPQVRGRSESSSLLSLPFHGENGENHITVQVWLSGEDGASQHPAGVRMHAKLPGSFAREAAENWCQLLNGGDGSDETAVTASWQYGNWYHTPVSDEEGAEHRIAYYATLPHKLRGRIDLAAEVDATAREILSSGDRVMFARRHTWMMAPEDVGAEGEE